MTLHGKGFSFQVMEPEGWTLSTRAAPQIASFVFHRQGVDWRSADALILARFVPRESGESVEEFIQSTRETFEQECPFADEESSELPVDRFAIEVYHCPGVRKEIAAVTPVPGFFVILTLTSQDEDAYQHSLQSFRNVVRSFRWFDLPVDPLGDRQVPQGQE